MILTEIQQALKAPKGQFNAFGKYHYRSTEDILEAIKPLLGDSILTLSDEMVILGDRFYVKATAEFKTSENVVQQATGYAREAQTKKGMDEAQVTASASSFARKLALNGLFCIDDSKEVGGGEASQNEELISGEEVSQIENLVLEKKKDVGKFLAYFKIQNYGQLNKSQFKKALEMMA